MPEGIVVNGYGVLNRDPLVIHVFRYLDDIFPALAEIVQMVGQSRDVTFLISLGWSIVAQFEHGRLETMSKGYFDIITKYPLLKIIYLANDMTEMHLLRQLGMEAVLCQHNAFLRPSTYLPETSGAETQRRGALYIARLHPYKRVELMAELSKSALIYGSYDSDYYAKIKASIAHVTLLNGDPTPESFKVLGRQEVMREVYNSSVGLCLSYVEGAMFSSAEYLLAGLPIVSTYSVGGRDAYYDPRFWFLCPPDAASVARAVDEALDARISASEIRARTVVKTMSMRLGLIDYLKDQHGTKRDATDLYARLLDINSEFRWKQDKVETLLARVK